MLSNVDMSIVNHLFNLVSSYLQLLDQPQLSTGQMILIGTLHQLDMEDQVNYNLNQMNNDTLYLNLLRGW